MPEAIRIQLPIPPSLNNAYGNRKDGRGRYPTKALRDWKVAAGWTIQAAPKRRIAGKYRISISVCETMRGDIDNRVKFLTDALVANRVTPDDRFAYSISVTRSHDVDPGQCIVEVAPV